MGTRHLICAVIDGQFKLAQYGQWDGYLSGQGKDVCEFIQSTIVHGPDAGEEFRRNLRASSFLTPDEVKATWVACGADPERDSVPMDIAGKHDNAYPELSRNTGAKILGLIAHGPRRLDDDRNFAADSLFCEYAYLLDMDRDVLEVYKGFQHKPHGTGRFADMAVYAPKHRTDQYFPVRLIGELPFTQATKDGIMALEKKESDEFEEEH